MPVHRAWRNSRGWSRLDDHLDHVTGTEVSVRHHLLERVSGTVDIALREPHQGRTGFDRGTELERLLICLGCRRELTPSSMDFATLAVAGAEGVVATIASSSRAQPLELDQPETAIGVAST